MPITDKLPIYLFNLFDGIWIVSKLKPWDIDNLFYAFHFWWQSFVQTRTRNCLRNRKIQVEPEALCALISIRVVDGSWCSYLHIVCCCLWRSSCLLRHIVDNLNAAHFEIVLSMRFVLCVWFHFCLVPKVDIFFLLGNETVVVRNT